METEADLLRIRSSDKETATAKHNSHAKAPKLPEFRKERDEMESYFLIFERFAATNNWPKEQWATHMSALLSDDALDTYTRLSEKKNPLKLLKRARRKV
ncbi:SCAN domain-containing protein 3 [Elysia marginata]|uniref:SCAN domain-containing protein 3 n=1 Tax=Elysia marginata TaxID=1093978 RepID=A0AAV4I862_9GAST|nr:SCAN domain-containing protein 3 [Elysia marginata]